MVFIAFMQKCYNQFQSGIIFDTPKPKLTDEPFLGKWPDREDLADSSAWVHQSRQNEWGMKT